MTKNKPRLLDLFCGAGGATRGYQEVGFYVVGVDIHSQPNYCGDEFYQADALTYPLEGFDAYHASPPCQRFAQCVKKKNRVTHPDYIDDIRQRLINKIYVIENVPQAPLLEPVILCGSMFGLPLRRHRYFESTVHIPRLACRHADFKPRYPCAWNRVNPLRVLSISGGYQRGIDLETYKAGFGIDWEISKRELSEAIPPAYTEYVGQFLLKAVKHDT